jgi:cytochrome c553
LSLHNGAVILPWERRLWECRPVLLRTPRVRYLLTDLRLVRLDGRKVTEMLLDDIADIRQTRSPIDTLLGTSTLVVRSRPGASLELRGVRRGAQLAAVLELLSGDRPAPLDERAVREALAWDPRGRSRGAPRVAAVAVLAIAGVFTVAIGLHGTTKPPTYPADDPIAPNGVRRPRAEIARFMEQDVLPWARATLGPIKGGPDQVTCLTCHGADAESRNWQMPAVARLPEPALRDQGWEHFGGTMDAQMRNAIYGYLAEADNQTRAAYMREIVLPGMARVLRRPAYDFTQPYQYNRDRLAFGCYHCHRVN